MKKLVVASNNKGKLKEIKEIYAKDSEFRKCIKKENYKKVQRLELCFKHKIRNFLMYHKMWRIFKILANKK